MPEIATILVAYAPEIVSVRLQNIFRSEEFESAECKTCTIALLVLDCWICSVAWFWFKKKLWSTVAN